MIVIASTHSNSKGVMNDYSISNGEMNDFVQDIFIKLSKLNTLINTKSSAVKIGTYNANEHWIGDINK